MGSSQNQIDAVERRNRAQKRALRTRKRLLETALTLFSEKGVEATTIHDITEAADLGKGTFYRHFSSKEAVMAALVEDVVSRLIEHIRAAGQPPQNLQDALHHLLERQSLFFRDHRNEFVLLFQGRLLPKLQREFSGPLEEPFALYLQEIERQLAAFVPEPLDPTKVRRVAHAAAGFVSSFFAFAVMGMTAKDVEAALEPLRRAFVAGCLTFLLNKT